MKVKLIIVIMSHLSDIPMERSIAMIHARCEFIKWLSLKYENNTAEIDPEAEWEEFLVKRESVARNLDRYDANQKPENKLADLREKVLTWLRNMKDNRKNEGDKWSDGVANEVDSRIRNLAEIAGDLNEMFSQGQEV